MSAATNDKTGAYIMYAMVAAVFLGLGLNYFDKASLMEPLTPIGVIFIRLLKMVIIPLVASSIFISMVNLGTPKELGSIGTKAMGYYFVTTSIAVFIGLIVVNLVGPGQGVDLASFDINMSDTLSTKLREQKGLYHTVLGVIIDAIPKNPFESMSKTSVLQVIVFSILFGIVALFHKKESEHFINFMSSLEFMSMQLTNGIMKIAPFGIFVLMLEVVSKAGVDVLLKLGVYMLTVIGGLLIHAIFLLLLGSSRAKMSPIKILQGLWGPISTAFSTASSAATLPLTMKAVQDNLKVNPKTSKFVLPLGATVNMDGTALYESVAVIFIGQIYGLDLSITNQIIIFMTASLAAVGAAAIPGAGLITMSIVLNAVGYPLEGIGIILAVDRILDMFRTAVNVFGDSVGAVVVDSLIDKDCNNS